MNIAKKHPITVALELLSPVIGGNFTLHSIRDKSTSGAKKYPLVEYAILQNTGADYLPSQNTWKIHSLIQLDYYIKESILSQYCKENSLEGLEDIYALFALFHARLRFLITMMVNPTGIDRRLREGDFPHTAYEFKLIKAVHGFNYREHGGDKLTGVSQRYIISYLDQHFSGEFCCIKTHKAELLKVVKDGSVSSLIIQNGS